MSFQYVIDNATEISISKRQRVSQTVSRSGVVKTTSLGGQVYEFRVRLPSGPRWSDNRSLIEKVEALDRTTVDTISINNPGQDYIIGYQGDEPNPNNISVTTIGTNLINIASGVTIGSGFIFKAGDYIQLGNNSVYTVIEDVSFSKSTFLVHRPVKEADATYSLSVGQDVSWDVICVNLPSWSIFGYDQIQWDGDFVFVEAL